jgi:RNA polymerase sigma-70 factor, ECF subfamily
MRLKKTPASQSSTNNLESFEILYEEYFHRVYAYIASRLETQKDAEDLVAEIFIKAMQRFSQFRGENLSAWLFTIAHNALQDLYRKQKPLLFDLEDELISDTETPEQTFLTLESQREILRHIQALSPRRQEIVTLKFYAQLRNQEIAEILGINEQSVASHLHRALSDLKARLVPIIAHQVESK